MKQKLADVNNIVLLKETSIDKKILVILSVCCGEAVSSQLFARHIVSF